MHILVLNCGSSSLRFQVIETDLDMIAAEADRRLGRIERIGGHALVSFQAKGAGKVLVLDRQFHRRVDGVMERPVGPPGMEALIGVYGSLSDASPASAT